MCRDGCARRNEDDSCWEGKSDRLGEQQRKGQGIAVAAHQHKQIVHRHSWMSRTRKGLSINRNGDGRARKRGGHGPPCTKPKSSLLAHWFFVFRSALEHLHVHHMDSVLV